MGAGMSSIVGSEGDGGLGELPESCVAAVLLYLDPPEICRLARLSRTFRGAALSDFVWETKLPRNYRYLMEKALNGINPKFLLSKKEIYARLCRPNPFDGGTKEFWLEKCKGGVCMSISSKALSITGIDDRRYWNYIPTEESRFLAPIHASSSNPSWLNEDHITSVLKGGAETSVLKVEQISWLTGFDLSWTFIGSGLRKKRIPYSCISSANLVV